MLLQTACELLIKSYEKPNRVRWDEQLYVEGDVFAISGSNDRIDWSQNFAGGYEMFYGVYGRRGFIDSARTIMSSHIWDEMVSLGDITIVGHSQGAGTGQLLTYALAEYGVRVTCICFGCPHVTFVAPRKRYDIFEYHAFGDVVPWLPPYIPFYRPYKHLGQYVRVGSRWNSLWPPGKHGIHNYHKIFTQLEI